MNKAVNFFTHAEKERIREATSSVETKTSGEIAVMVVDASSHYREAEVLGAITFGNVAAFLITIFFLHESLWWYVPLTFATFLLSAGLQKGAFLKVHFTGVKRRQRAVRDRAVRRFMRKGSTGRQETRAFSFLSPSLRGRSGSLPTRVFTKRSPRPGSTHSQRPSPGV